MATGGWEEAVASLVDVTDEQRVTGNLVRAVSIRPEHDCWDRCAFDKATCEPYAAGWHGIGSRSIFWSVAVPGRGAVSMELFTPIYTNIAIERGGRSLAETIERWSPLGKVDFHYATPPDYLGGQDPIQACQFTGVDCWGDVTFLTVEEGFDAYVAGGTRGVWAWLGEKYLPGVLNHA